MDYSLSASYAEILKETDPSFLDPAKAQERRLSTPFLVNGPKDPSACRIMVIGREYGGKGWKVKPNGSEVSDYVTEALATHRRVFDRFLLQENNSRVATFPNFLRDLAMTLGTADGLIYSNLLCIDSRGKSPTKSKYFTEIKSLSKRLLDLQISYFKPDVIIFANGTGGEQVRIRREFFPMQGEERIFVSRRNWEEAGIRKGQLEEFELYGKFLCYRIQHPANWRGEVAVEAQKARRQLLEILVQTLPQRQLVAASTTGAAPSLLLPCEP